MGKLSWQARLFSLIALIMGILLLFNLFYIIPYIKNRELEITKVQQQETVRNIARELDTDLTQSRDRLIGLTQRAEFRNMDTITQQETMSTIAEGSLSFESLFVMDAEGWFISAGGVDDFFVYTTKSYADKPYFTTPFEQGEVYFDEPKLSTTPELMSVNVAVPIESDKGERVGVLIGAFSLNQLVDMVANYPLDEGTIAYVVDTEGTVVAHSGIDLLALEEGALSLNYNDWPMVQVIMDGETSGAQQYKHDDISYFGTFTVLESNSWGVVVARSMGAILAPTNALTGQLLWVNITLFGIALLTLLFFTRQITAQQKKTEEERVKDVSAVIEAMGDGLLLHTIDGKVTFVNTAFEKITGYERSGLVGKDVADVGAKFTKLEGAQITAAAIETTMKGETPTPEPITFVSKEGKETPVLFGVSFIRDTEGEPTIAVVVFKDITQLKKIEEKLEHLNRVLRAIRNVNQFVTKERDREKLLKGICNNLTETRGYYNVWIALLDESGKLIAHAESGLGSSFLPMVERLKRGELTACGQQALKQSEAVVTEDPASICTDCPLSRNYVGRGAATVRLEYGGKVYGFLSVSIPIELAVDIEEVGLFREVATDIAFALYNIELEGERKRAEEALRESEESFRVMMEQSPIGIQIMTTDGRIVQVNDAYVNLWGVTLDDVSEYNILQDEQSKSLGLMPYIERAFAGETTSLPPFEYDARRTVQKGEKRWVQSYIYPVKGESGEIRNVVMMHEDITELKRAEDKLKEHSQSLEEMVGEHTRQLQDAQEELLRSERLATLGQVSGSISHEIRNPLGVIDSSVYYLKTKLKDADKKTLEHLERIKSSVDSSIAIMDSLLNLTRVKELRLENLDLVAITTDAISTSKVPARVSVTQNFPEQEVLVNADREQLRMAFKNIVKNAVEAMDGKGTLTVTVGGTVGSQVEVSFVDTGPGIAMEDLEKIFQPLFSTKAKGIGFGLSIAKMVVDKHGGTIEAKSEPGKGANIIIWLPVENVKIKNKI